MEQISRPFQIALIAVVGLSLVWFVALRKHGSSSTNTPVATAAAPAPAPSTASAHAKLPVASSSEPAEGYSSAIDKAHGAVIESQQNARQLENRSAQASNEAVPAHGSAGSAAAAADPHAATKPSQHTPTTATRSSQTATGTKSTSTARQSASGPAGEVQQEIAQGDTVILLFWNPKAVDDVAVHKQLELAEHALGHKVVIHDASAKQIGIFGQITQDVTVYQTPTILIVNRNKLVTTLTGFTDAFSITQAVREAQK
jgi:hypothetical protein